MDASTYLRIEKSRSGLHAKFQALRDTELAWYTEEALNHLGLKKLPSKKEDQLIQQILGKSPNDNEKKRSEKIYYVANVSAYLKVVKGLLTDEFVRRFDGSQALDDLVIYNYHRVFRNLLYDSLVLLNEYSTIIKKQPGRYGCGKNPWQHSLTLYQSLRQSI